VTRKCSECGSERLGMVAYNGPFWRKECLDCGSTGPFIPLDADPSALPWIAQRSSAQLEASVARFCDEDVARAEAEQARARVVERLKATGDEHARRLTETLDLPPGVRVVFDSEPLIEESA
jgi:hypothetical protein